jgi:hypothetical protein
VRFSDSIDLGEARHIARRKSLLELPVRKEYDFFQVPQNPYAKQLKRSERLRHPETASTNSMAAKPVQADRQGIMAIPD